MEYNTFTLDTEVYEGHLFISMPGKDIIDTKKAVRSKYLDFFKVLFDENGQILGLCVFNAAEFMPRELVEEYDFFKEEGVYEMPFVSYVCEDSGYGMFYFYPNPKEDEFSHCELLGELGLVADLTLSGRLKALEFLGTYHDYLN